MTDKEVVKLYYYYFSKDKIYDLFFVTFNQKRNRKKFQLSINISDSFLPK